MAIKITKSAELADSQAIHNFEITEGIIVPNQLKDFWKNYNAIYVEQNIYFKNNDKYYLDRFFPFSNEQELTFQFVYKTLTEYLGKEYLSFANDSGDWQFLISVNQNSYGKVFLCRMDDIIPDSLIEIADSFEEFINGLKREDEAS